jgi:agmatine/peptidylarginine deiminase
MNEEWDDYKIARVRKFAFLAKNWHEKITAVELLYDNLISALNEIERLRLLAPNDKVDQ